MRYPAKYLPYQMKLRASLGKADDTMLAITKEETIRAIDERNRKRNKHK